MFNPETKRPSTKQDARCALGAGGRAGASRPGELCAGGEPALPSKRARRNAAASAAAAGHHSQVSGSAASRRGLHFPPGALTGIAAMAHNWRALRFAA